MENWKRYIPLYLRLFRAFMLYPCFLLIWALSMLTMAGFHTDAQFILTAAAIWMPFVFFSVARIFAESDAQGNAALGDMEGRSFFSRIGAVLCSRSFWIDAAFPLGLFLILPAEAGFYHVDLVLLSGFSGVVARLLLYAIGLPLLFVLLLFARLSAWQKHIDDSPVFKQPDAPERSGPDLVTDTVARARWASGSVGAPMVLPNDSVETISSEGRAWLRRENRKKHFLLQLLGVVVIYTLGGFGLFLAVPVFISAWAILAKIGTVRWWLPVFLLLAVIGGFWLWHALRAVLIRHKLIKNLKCLCREYGFRLERIKRPYSSLFRYRCGPNFRLHANGKVYDCKLFSAMRRHWEMYFHESGKLTTRRALRFRRVEFFRFSSEYEFDFDSKHERVCIVAPVPKVIYAGNGRWNRPIDTGTRVGKYRIFSSTGFLNALKRDCVEKD